MIGMARISWKGPGASKKYHAERGEESWSFGQRYVMLGRRQKEDV